MSTISQWRERAREIIQRTTGHLPREERVKLLREQQLWIEDQIERAWRLGDKERGDTALDILEIRLRSAAEKIRSEHS
jgi:hypothetical protein